MPGLYNFVKISAMTKLSVNINKIATIRNARGGNVPDILKAAVKIQEFGAEGITVHPRPDERHIRYQDVLDLRPLVFTEFNIEGYPSRGFLDLVLLAKPEQVTLVPDPPEALTSNAGWNIKLHLHFLQDTIAELKSAGIRTSIFVDTVPDTMYYARETGTDRVELYTEPYATDFPVNPVEAIREFVQAAEIAREMQLGVNAGHDLNLDNLRYFVEHIPGLLEVSIGHALIADALYLGMAETVSRYKALVKI